jgi:transcriptional regulator with XRE-family HTH domain
VAIDRHTPYDLNFLVHVGERIRYFRSEIRDETQAQLASRIGTKQSYLSRVEWGIAYGVSLLFLKQVADGLEVNVLDLMGHSEKPPTSNTDKQLRHMFTRISSFNEKNKRIIIHTLRALLESVDTPPSALARKRAKNRFTRSQTN